MDRLQGFLVIMLAISVQKALTHSLEPNIAFELDLSKYKLPEAYYPDNDPDTIPAFQPIRRAFVSDIDVTKYKLPEDFFPENDRDVIPILPIRKSSISDSKRQEDSGSIYSTRRMLPDIDLKNKQSDAPDKILMEKLLNKLKFYGSYPEDRMDNSLYSPVADEDVYDRQRTKQKSKLMQRIVEDLKMLKMLEKEEGARNQKKYFLLEQKLN